jgi:hypothetical protein
LILRTYRETARQVSLLRQLHGHDGGQFATYRAFDQALDNGSDKGEFIIPPMSMLLKNLYKNKDGGAFKGTFVTDANGLDVAYCYWTIEQPCDPYSRMNVSFSTGSSAGHDRDNGIRLNSRPCRLMESISHLVA